MEIKTKTKNQSAIFGDTVEMFRIKQIRKPFSVKI